MKNKMLWIGSVFILILSVICFVVFGVGTELIKVFKGDESRISFGKYDGKEIVREPNTEFANAVNNFTKRMQEQKELEAQRNPSIKNELEQKDYLEIYSYSFNAAVQSLAYKNAVAETGYKPSSKGISFAMLPLFLNGEGKYDPKFYNMLPNSTKESLKSEFTTMSIWKRFSNDMFGGTKYFGEYIACLQDYRTAFDFNSAETVGDYALYGLKTNEKETGFLASLENEKRAFDAVAFDKNDYPLSEVKAFASSNKDLFDTYSLSVLTVKEESQAKKLRGQISNGEVTFKDAVTEYSEKYYGDGDGNLKENFAYQIKEDLENEADFDKIAALTKDGLSEVVKTNRGYSLFQCKGEKSSADFSDEATLEVVKTYIKSNKQDLIDAYFTEKAKAFASDAKSSGFDSAAATFGLEKVSIPAFALNYGNASLLGRFAANGSKAFSNASSNEEFLTKAFSMGVNEISEPLVMDNYITVFMLKSIEKAETNSEKADSIKAEIASYDQEEALTTLFSGSKVENNVISTYISKCMPR